MKKVIFLFIFASVLPFIAYSHNESHEPQVISAETINKMMHDDANLRLIDARREKDYWEEHIEGALSLPATEVNAQSLAEVVRNMETKLIFYCQNTKCQASRIAGSKAIGAGYRYVYEYSGGIEDWKDHDYPTKMLKVKAAE